MKNLVIIICILLFNKIVTAQVPTSSPYPDAPMAATNISSYVFYVDTINSTTNQLVNFAPTLVHTNASQVVNLPGVQPGVHQLYAKVTTTNGVSSIYNIGNFYLEGTGYNYPNTPAAATNISSYVFYVDTINSTTNQSVNFAPSLAHTNASQVVNLPGVQPGVHQLYAKVTTTDGVSSIHNIGNFYLEGTGYNYPNTPAAATNITAYTFYVDTINSTTNQTISFAPSFAHTNASQVVNLPSVQPGVHQLYAKVTTTDGVSSIHNIGNFYLEGAGYNYPNTPATAPLVSSLEYYFDTDPGLGMGTPINITAAQNVNLANELITIPPSLTVGNHILHIRCKQNPWSIDATQSFEKLNTLPVSWLYVKGQHINSINQVLWATASEDNTLNFQIEHSVNGTQFNPIGTVAAAGNSTTTKHYSFNHLTFSKGANFYRIKQIDNNSNYKYSTVVKLFNNDKISTATILANPVRNNLQIVVPYASYIKSVVIYSADGEVKLQKEINNTLQNLDFSISNFASGNYLIKINYNNHSNTITFVKQ